MALRYEDYKNRQENIEDEIEDASRNQEEREQQTPDNSFEVPERFRADTPEESLRKVLNSYGELERRFSQQGNDLGEMRKLVDQMFELESARGSNKQEEEPEQVDVGVDDLYDDPRGAIEKVVNNTVGKDLEKLQRERIVEQIEREKAKLTEDFPNWQELPQNPEFVDWVKERQYRQRWLMDANQYDFDSARALFEEWGAQSGQAGQDGRQDEERRQRRDEDLRQAELESGGEHAGTPEETYSRRKLIELKVSARQGNREAITYLAEHADAIQQAYLEGRVVD
jgi:hypothetical protein